MVEPDNPRIAHLKGNYKICLSLPFGDRIVTQRAAKHCERALRVAKARLEWLVNELHSSRGTELAVISRQTQIDNLKALSQKFRKKLEQPTHWPTSPTTSESIEADSVGPVSSEECPTQMRSNRRRLWASTAMNGDDGAKSRPRKIYFINRRPNRCQQHFNTKKLSPSSDCSYDLSSQSY